MCRPDFARHGVGEPDVEARAGVQTTLGDLVAFDFARPDTLHFDAPVPMSVNPWALVLSLAAGVAIFRFKVGMIPTLAGCSLAGILLYGFGMIA